VTVVHDTRAFLESLVSSSDPAIGVRERLDALKLLSEMGGSPYCKCFEAEVDELSSRELDHFLSDLPALDDITAAEVVERLTRPTASARALYPRAAAALADYGEAGERSKTRRATKRAA
jgi:hypothetical protein